MDGDGVWDPEHFLFITIVPDESTTTDALLPIEFIILIGVVGLCGAIIVSVFFLRKGQAKPKHLLEFCLQVC